MIQFGLGLISGLVVGWVIEWAFDWRIWRPQFKNRPVSEHQATFRQKSNLPRDILGTQENPATNEQHNGQEQQPPAIKDE